MSFWIDIAVLLILLSISPFFVLILGMLWCVGMLCSERIDLEVTFNRLFGRLDRIVEMLEKKEHI